MPVLFNLKVSGALVMFNDRLETQKAGQINFFQRNNLQNEIEKWNVK